MPTNDELPPYEIAGEGKDRVIWVRPERQLNSGEKSRVRKKLRDKHPDILRIRIHGESEWGRKGTFK